MECQRPECIALRERLRGLLSVRASQKQGPPAAPDVGGDRDVVMAGLQSGAAFEPINLAAAIPELSSDAGMNTVFQMVVAPHGRKELKKALEMDGHSPPPSLWAVRKMVVINLLLAWMNRVRNHQLLPLWSIIIGLFFWAKQVSPLLWRLLSLLRLVPSRETIKKMICGYCKTIQFGPITQKTMNVVAVADNLDIFFRSWRGDRVGEMRHYCLRFLSALPVDHAAFEVSPTSAFCGSSNDRDWSFQPLSTAMWRQVVDVAWQCGRAVVDGTARLGYSEAEHPSLPPTYMFICEPGFHDVMSQDGGVQLLDWLLTLHREHGRPTQSFTHFWPALWPMVVDGQLFLLLSRLQDTETTGYWRQIVLVPGLFHYMWHVLKAIHKLWGPWLLRWAHGLIRPQSVAFDVECKVFDKSEHFLEQVTVAVLLWARSYMGPTTKMPHHLLNKYKQDEVSCGLLTFLFASALPYFRLRALCRIYDGANGESINQLLVYFVGHFVATNKYNYVEIVLRFQTTLTRIHPSWRALILDHCLCGRVAHGAQNAQPFDMIQERINCAAKNGGMRSRPSDSKLLSFVPTLNFSMPFVEGFRCMLDQATTGYSMRDNDDSSFYSREGDALKVEEVWSSPITELRDLLWEKVSDSRPFDRRAPVVRSHTTLWSICGGAPIVSDVQSKGKKSLLATPTSPSAALLAAEKELETKMASKSDRTEESAESAREWIRHTLSKSKETSDAATTDADDADMDKI